MPYLDWFFKALDSVSLDRLEVKSESKFHWSKSPECELSKRAEAVQSFLGHLRSDLSSFLPPSDIGDIETLALQILNSADTQSIAVVGEKFNDRFLARRKELVRLVRPRPGSPKHFFEEDPDFVQYFPVKLIHSYKSLTDEKRQKVQSLDLTFYSVLTAHTEFDRNVISETEGFVFEYVDIFFERFRYFVRNRPRSPFGNQSFEYSSIIADFIDKAANVLAKKYPIDVVDPLFAAVCMSPVDPFSFPAIRFFAAQVVKELLASQPTTGIIMKWVRSPVLNEVLGFDFYQYSRKEIEDLLLVSEWIDNTEPEEEGQKTSYDQTTFLERYPPQRLRLEFDDVTASNVYANVVEIQMGINHLADTLLEWNCSENFVTSLHEAFCKLEVSPSQIEILLSCFRRIPTDPTLNKNYLIRLLKNPRVLLEGVQTSEEPEDRFKLDMKYVQGLSKPDWSVPNHLTFALSSLCVPFSIFQRFTFLVVIVFIFVVYVEGFGYGCHSDKEK